MKIKEIMLEITGVRPGNCSGCNIDTLRNMAKWLTNYEAEQAKIVIEKPKLGRPKQS